MFRYTMPWNDIGVVGGLLTLNVTRRVICESVLVVMMLWFKATKPGGMLHIGNETEAIDGETDIVLSGVFIVTVTV